MKNLTTAWCRCVLGIVFTACLLSAGRAHAISGIQPGFIIENASSFSFEIASDGSGLYDNNGFGAVIGPADAQQPGAIPSVFFDLNYLVEEQGPNNNQINWTNFSTVQIGIIGQYNPEPLLIVDTGLAGVTASQTSTGGPMFDLDPSLFPDGDHQLQTPVIPSLVVNNMRLDIVGTLTFRVQGGQIDPTLPVTFNGQPDTAGWHFQLQGQLVPIPEPSALALTAFGLVVVGGAWRRRDLRR